MIGVLQYYTVWSPLQTERHIYSQFHAVINKKSKVTKSNQALIFEFIGAFIVHPLEQACQCLCKIILSGKLSLAII